MDVNLKRGLTMEKLMSSVLQWLTKGENVVLATIIANSGSTPRGAGARMAIIRDGSFTGTIGGGSLEYRVQQMALEALERGESQSKSFCLCLNDKEDLGMICGGDVTVYIQHISAYDEKSRKLFKFGMELFSQNIDSWIVTDITDETEWRMGIFSERSNGKNNLPDLAQKKELFTNRGVKVEISGREYYSEPLTRAGKVYVFGGGHISQELVPLLSNLGFKCILFDSLEKFACKELFPAAENIIVGDFNNISAKTAITEKDYVVIMTRGHKLDFAVQVQVLKLKPYYTGVIGSRNKTASVSKKLLEHGFTQDEINRIHSPIGISIKADTPAEIAVSIAAELILIRSNRYSIT
jgi:xanthine dehydrogenase accessory factor